MQVAGWPAICNHANRQTHSMNSCSLVCSIFLSVAVVASSLAAEKNPPGDIPDNQVFLKYASAAGGYSLKVPEGWARIEDGADVSFTDNTTV